MVGVTSTLGAGSLFHAVLPFVPIRPIESRLCRPPAEPARGHVLVVEDDDRDRELIASTLARAGYGFEIARNGADAISRCRERMFDALTLDLLFARHERRRRARVLRVDGLIHNTPVIVVTIVADVKMPAQSQRLFCASLSIETLC